MPKSSSKTILVGVGLDSDGHKRISSGKNFVLIGGTETTHNVLIEKTVKINEHLKRRGKELSEIGREEFDEIADKVGLRRNPQRD